VTFQTAGILADEDPIHFHTTINTKHPQEI